MTPGSTRKKGGGWGRGAAKKSRLSTAECTSIVDGLKLIYFSKACASLIELPLAGGASPFLYFVLLFWSGLSAGMLSCRARAQRLAHC